MLSAPLRWNFEVFADTPTCLSLGDAPSFEKERECRKVNKPKDTSTRACLQTEFQILGLMINIPKVEGGAVNACGTLSRNVSVKVEQTLGGGIRKVCVPFCCDLTTSWL